MRPINSLPESMPHHISSGLSLLVKERTQNHSPTAPEMMGMIGICRNENDLCRCRSISHGWNPRIGSEPCGVNRAKMQSLRTERTVFRHLLSEDHFCLQLHEMVWDARVNLTSLTCHKREVLSNRPSASGIWKRQNLVYSICLPQIMQRRRLYR